MLKISYLCSIERKMGKWALGQREFGFRPARIYYLPRAEKIPSGSRQSELINHKLLIFDFLLHFKRSAPFGAEIDQKFNSKLIKIILFNFGGNFSLISAP